MSGVGQAVFMNQRSFGLIIGQAFGGGFFAGQISTTANGVATHNLVIAPKAGGQATRAWKNAQTATPGADSDIDGPQNTADIVADGDSTVYPAAHFCNNVSLGGFSDWYMPAKNELEVCYFNLKPGTNINNTSSGKNPNAVPARAGNYIGDSPAQTSAAAFLFGTAEAFDGASYWSSTEGDIAHARGQTFVTGFQFGGAPYGSKDVSYRVRAVRRVAV